MQVLGGYRLTCPDACPFAVNSIMFQCWKEPDERPSFSELNVHNKKLIEGPWDVDATSTQFPNPVNLLTKSSRYKSDIPNASTLTYMSPDAEQAKPKPLQHMIPDIDVSANSSHMLNATASPAEADFVFSADNPNPGSNLGYFEISQISPAPYLEVGRYLLSPIDSGT